MEIIHKHYEHAETLSKQDMLTLMLRSVEQKLVSAIEIFGFTSYGEAKAYIQHQSTAGTKVWEILDARYAGRMHP